MELNFDYTDMGGWKDYFQGMVEALNGKLLNVEQFWKTYIADKRLADVFSSVPAIFS